MTLKLEDLPRLHSITKAVANCYRQRLEGHLSALAPLFRPRRLLGDYIESSGREKVPQAEENFRLLRESYERVAKKPFGLKAELSTPLESISSDVKLSEWEYIYDGRRGKEHKRILVRSPLTWIVGYPSTYSLSMIRGVLAGSQTGDKHGVAAFVVRACLMDLLFDGPSGLGGLFEELRFRVEVKTLPEMGSLPLVALSLPFSTVRPDNKTLLAATGMSGREVFDEILDVASVRSVSDPIREQMAAILAEHGEDL